MDKKHFKDWHIILMIIVILSIATAGMLYAQKVGNDTAKEVKELKPKVIYLEKCFEVERATRDGEFKILQMEIKALRKESEESKVRDEKIIIELKKINDSAVIITRPLIERD